MFTRWADMLRRLARACDVLGGEEPRLTVVVSRVEVCNEDPDKFAADMRDMLARKDWPSA